MKDSINVPHPQPERKLKMKWNAKRIACLVLISPLIAVLLVMLSPAIVLGGLIFGLCWVIETAFGLEHESV